MSRSIQISHLLLLLFSLFACAVPQPINGANVAAFAKNNKPKGYIRFMQMLNKFIKVQKMDLEKL